MLVYPKVAVEENKWLFKTEYFDAFPTFELEMLSRGYYVANVENANRRCLEEDTERQYAFAKFSHKEFGLNEKCMTVGMSCGGMQSVYLGAKYPNAVACMYLDAPVLNLLSCPCGLGKGTTEMYEEFVTATGKTIFQMVKEGCDHHAHGLSDNTPLIEFAFDYYK